MRKAKYQKLFTVGLRPAVYKQIKQIADKREISIGQWVRDAIDEVLSAEKVRGNAGTS